MRVLQVAAGSFFLLGMLGGTCGESVEPPASPVQEVEDEEPVNRFAEPEPPSGFTVHEWGLIGHHYTGSGPTLLATGRGRGQSPPPPPRTPPPPQSGKAFHGEEGKPIIYVHLDDPGGATPVRATLDIGEGQMVEHLPTAARSGSRYTWDLIARRGSCGAAERYPRGGMAGCWGRADGYCEAAELATYETDDAACLSVDGEDWNHLFYRTRVTRPPPVQVRREGDGFVVRTTAALPGKLIRIRRGERPDDTRVQLIDAPSPGTELPLPPDALSPVAVLHAADASRELRAQLTRLGMTASETAAFMRAWSADLLGSQAPLRNSVQDMRAPRDLQPKEDALIYFLPEDVVQRMAPLSFEPAAREVRRAILVRIDLTEAVGEPEAAESLPEASDARTRLVWMGLRVEGPLDGDAVSPQQRTHERELRSCYEDALRADGASTGLAELRYTIGSDGSTKDVDVRWRAGGNEEFAGCLRAAISRWTFERSAGADSMVRQRLLFERR